MLQIRLILAWKTCSHARPCTRIRTGSKGERTVLGLLVLSGRVPVSLDELVEALWPLKPPRSASAVVQTYVSRLRGVLGARTHDGRERLSRDGSGYQLELADSEVDLVLFSRLLREARAACIAANVGEACHTYDRALSLWYGKPFANINSLSGHSVIARLIHERAAAIIEYAGVASGAGCYSDALAQLRMLVSEEPLDETAHAHLMIALARSGRQSEALSIYEEMRLRLDEELGVYPGAVLQEAHARVLQQELPPAVVNRATLSLPGGSGDPEESYAGILGQRPICQLPPSVSDFTGRRSESRILGAALEPDNSSVSVAVAAISGAPGVGKTALCPLRSP